MSKGSNLNFETGGRRRGRERQLFERCVCMYVYYSESGSGRCHGTTYEKAVSGGEREKGGHVLRDTVYV